MTHKSRDHVTRKDREFILKDWGGEVFVSTFSNNSSIEFLLHFSWWNHHSEAHELILCQKLFM